MTVGQGAKQHIAIILTVLGFISSAFTGMVAWSYAGMATDVKNLTTSVPRLEDRQAYMVKAADMDKAVLAALTSMVGSHDKHGALVEQRLANIEEQLKNLKGFLDFYVRKNP